MPPNPKLIDAQSKMAKAQADAQAKQVKGKEMMAKLMIEAGKSQAQVDLMHAQAVKALADAKGVQSGHAIAAMEALIGAEKSRNDTLMDGIKLLMDLVEGKDGEANAGGVPGMEPAPGNTSVPGAPPGAPAQTDAGLGGGGIQPA
jgi:hypothetical protein